MKLLHIDSAITGEASVSRKLSADVVAHLERLHPADLELTYRDLFADPLDHLTLGDMPAPETPHAVLDEFLAADIVVIGAPMYNFAMPSQLKAWVDRILVAGRTFRYGDAGPVGLAGNTRVIVAVSRGNLYADDAPAASHEHLETHLRTVFGFIGVTPEFVVAEGLLVGTGQREKALADAGRAIEALAA
ncbi:FMN-dependent NADH-azoreductase [Luteimonas abyssi]|uniref:FMN-dependent NADH-azoreductase n=1 Tax=Luteimonas abyssi TaxID=1247514 RepID=UPI000737ADFA|nr:NAD(P)H-dependent oxidoreductase [Luteimonas abyssi]